MAKYREKLSDQLRKAIDESELSRYRICQEIGLAESTMSKFMSRQGGLSLAFIDALADLLELNITGNKIARKGE